MFFVLERGMTMKQCQDRTLYKKIAVACKSEKSRRLACVDNHLLFHGYLFVILLVAGLIAKNVLLLGESGMVLFFVLYFLIRRIRLSNH